MKPATHEGYETGYETGDFHQGHETTMKPGMKPQRGFMLPEKVLCHIGIFLNPLISFKINPKSIQIASNTISNHFNFDSEQNASHRPLLVDI